jgi:hypothetical protein
MAFSQSDLLTIGGVLALLGAVIVYNNFRAARAKAAATPATVAVALEAPGTHPLLGRFVQHEGGIVGEVVAVDGERTILRQSGVHYAVPVARLEPRGGDLALVGPFDREAARLAAADWKA